MRMHFYLSCKIDLFFADKPFTPLRSLFTCNVAYRHKMLTCKFYTVTYLYVNSIVMRNDGKSHWTPTVRN